MEIDYLRRQILINQLSMFLVLENILASVEMNPDINKLIRNHLDKSRMVTRSLLEDELDSFNEPE